MDSIGLAGSKEEVMNHINGLAEIERQEVAKKKLVELGGRVQRR